MNITDKNGLNPNIDCRIRESFLPSVLSLKNGLQGDENSNPEIYLREFINKSQYFKKLSNFEEYSAPESEAHGECDAITSCYQLDFKTLISSSMGNGERNTTFQRIKVSPGVVITTRARSEKEYHVSLITKIFRNYTLSDLKDKTYKSDEELSVKDIDNLLNIWLY